MQLVVIAAAQWFLYYDVVYGTFGLVAFLAGLAATADISATIVERRLNEQTRDGRELSMKRPRSALGFIPSARTWL